MEIIFDYACEYWCREGWIVIDEYGETMGSFATKWDAEMFIAEEEEEREAKRKEAKDVIRATT